MPRPVVESHPPNSIQEAKANECRSASQAEFLPLIAENLGAVRSAVQYNGVRPGLPVTFIDPWLVTVSGVDELGDDIDDPSCNSSRLVLVKV